MTLPDPIDASLIGGFRSAHETWHENMHITSNLIFSGTGTPEGNQAAPVGAIFLRTDGGADTSLYTKESGTGTAGWSALAGVP
jgi:hypothetical protein